MSDEIAISFSFNSEFTVMHKHGSPELVEKWADETRKKYIAGGLDDMAQEITVISGKFPLEDLNWLIQNSTSIVRFLKKHGIWDTLIQEQTQPLTIV